MLLCNERSCQAHYMGGCRSVSVAGSDRGRDFNVAAADHCSATNRPQETNLRCHRPIGIRWCACRNSNSHVKMMKSAEKWRRQNATNGMYCSRRRRVLVDRKVRASPVIVGCVRSQQMAKMPLAEHDNGVQTI